MRKLIVGLGSKYEPAPWSH